MKNIIILVLSFMLVVSCAPHIDYYKPLMFQTRCNFESNEKIHDYYFVKTIDSLEVRTKLIVGSLSKRKEILFNIGFNNSIRIDSVKIFSKHIKFTLNHKSIDDNNFTDEYFESFVMNDHKWYGNFKKGRDTLNVYVYYNNGVLEIPYYFNHKNRLETYPF